jgi:tetratricopeptide (TPR) repeat protein
LKTCSWILIFLAVASLGSAAYATDYDQARSAAEELSKAGNKAGAADLLERATGASTDVEAEWLRGYVGILRNAPAGQVINQFLKVAGTFPDSNRAGDALLRAGYLRDKLGEDPHQDWERLVRDYPGTREAAEALRQLGQCALRQGDTQLAISRFEQSAALSDVDADVAEDSQMQLGYAYISQYWKTLEARCLSKAGKALEPVTRSADTQRAIRAHIGRGEVFLRLGLPDPAWCEYKAVLALQPAEPYYRRIALFELACCEYESERWARAANAFDTFLADVPGTTLRGLVADDPG